MEKNSLSNSTVRRIWYLPRIDGRAHIDHMKCVMFNKTILIGQKVIWTSNPKVFYYCSIQFYIPKKIYTLG